MKTAITVLHAFLGLWFLAFAGCDNPPPQSSALGSVASAAEAKALGSATMEGDAHALEVGRLIVKADTSRDQSDMLVGVTGVTLDVVVLNDFTAVRKEDVLTKLELVLRRNNVPVVTNGMVLKAEIVGMLTKDTQGNKVDFALCTCSLNAQRFVLCPMATGYVYTLAPVWRSLIFIGYGETNGLNSRVMSNVEKLAEDFAVSFLRANAKSPQSN